jgi:hypothetical protein
MIDYICDFFGIAMKDYCKTLTQISLIKKELEYAQKLQNEIDNACEDITLRWKELEIKINNDAILLSQVKEFSRLMISPWHEKSYFMNRGLT